MFLYFWIIIDWVMAHFIDPYWSTMISFFLAGLAAGYFVKEEKKPNPSTKSIG